MCIRDSFKKFINGFYVSLSLREEDGFSRTIEKGEKW
jgi:hypothetical protein